METPRFRGGFHPQNDGGRGTARVLHLLGPSTGGIRRHVGFLAARLEERGWDVRVAGPAGVMGDAGRQDAVVPVPSGVASLGWPAARRALRGLDADVIHAHGLKAGWLASTIRGRPPLVVSVHNLVLDEAAGRAAPVLRWLEGRLPSRADHVIAVSADVARRFAGTATPVTVVPPAGPPPVPRRDGAEVRRALGAEGRPLVVTVARLHPQKGLDVLLDAAARLRASVPDVLVAVVGEGPLAAELRAGIEARGLGGTVLLAGPSAEAADELAAADVVAVPSRWESGPLVLVEALALGRPVVATPVGWVPDLVEDGVSGRVVPVGDAEALAGALARLLADPVAAAALGEEGRRRVAEGWGGDRPVSLVEDAYRAMLGRP